MKTTIFDLRRETGNVEQWAAHVKEGSDDHVEMISLREEHVNDCIGCWSCWLKTPGKCVWKDDMSQQYSTYMDSDRVLILSDVKNGFLSGHTKAFLDRIIPLYMPYIYIENKECHHVTRYDQYPDMYLHYDPAQVTVHEAQAIDSYWARTAYHFSTDAYTLSNLSEGSIAQKLTSGPALPEFVHPGAKAQGNHVVLYNGSPRRTGSNSALLLAQVKAGLIAAGKTVEIRELKDVKMHDEWARRFATEDNVLILFPLYIHAMPSIVMKFIEGLDPSSGSLGFIVQSGFPSSSQSQYIRTYLGLLSDRLGRSYTGTLQLKENHAFDQRYAQPYAPK